MTKKSYVTTDRQMAELWDGAHALRRFRPRYPHDEVVRWTFRNFDPHQKPKPRLLDLGAGAGRHAIFLAREGFSVCACDISQTGLGELGQAAQRQGLNVETTCTSADDLSHYESGSFDGVVCFGVLYYLNVDALARAIDEVLRILRPGGKFLCIMRTTSDGRLNGAAPVAPMTWCLDAIDANAPSNVEQGIEMLFLSEADVHRLFGSFANVSVGRMTIARDGFADDDWVIHAVKGP